MRRTGSVAVGHALQYSLVNAHHFHMHVRFRPTLNLAFLYLIVWSRPNFLPDK